MNMYFEYELHVENGKAIYVSVRKYDALIDQYYESEKLKIKRFIDLYHEQDRQNTHESYFTVYHEIVDKFPEELI